MIVMNTGQSEDTFDLSLAGPAALVSSLETPSVILTPGASQVVNITTGPVDFAYAGTLDLRAIATSRANNVVTDSATARVTVEATYGVTAEFDPDAVEIPQPGSGFFLLMVKNTGNTEDSFTAEITGTSGPVTSGLNGLDGRPTQTIPLFILPGLATGAILLNVNLQDYGEGTVTVQITSVSNAAVSSSDTATLTVINQPPVANAGEDQSTGTGVNVILNGSESFDPNMDMLTFGWTFVDVPAGSNITDAWLSDPADAKPDFTPDTEGTYVLELTVNDGMIGDTDAVSIFATTANIAPNANAGHDRNVQTGSIIDLDGSRSSDPDNGPQPLSFQWNFDALPPGSVLTEIINSDQADAGFTPDVDGTECICRG
jgi:hypothetical protein